MDANTTTNSMQAFGTREPFRVPKILLNRYRIELWNVVLDEQLRTRRGGGIPAEETEIVGNRVAVVIQFEAQAELRETSIACQFVDGGKGGAVQTDCVPASSQNRLEWADRLADRCIKVRQLQTGTVPEETFADINVDALQQSDGICARRSYGTVL
jgi:hypothetical protein